MHSDGMFDIAKHIAVDLDSEVKTEFFQPDINEIINIRILINTDFLRKHGGKDTITNSSSRGLNGFVLPEIRKSWDRSNFNDYSFYSKEMPIGTRVNYLGASPRGIRRKTTFRFRGKPRSNSPDGSQVQISIIE